MHGAALVHGLFMRRGGIIIELKTLYGFTSGLFSLVADARMGTLGQVDVRDYWIKGGHKAIDAPLVDRTMQVLKMAQKNQIGEVKCVGESDDKDSKNHNIKVVDCVVSAMDVTSGSPLDHILGPRVSELQESCRSTVLFSFRKNKLQSGKDELHCGKCSI